MTVLKTSMRNFFAHKGRMALSAVAVLLSVAFVCGTLVFSDTMNTTFDKLFAATSSDVTVSAKSASDTGETTSGNGRPPSMPASVLDQVRTAPGVKSAEGAVFSSAVTVVDADKDNLSPSSGAPTIVGSWNANEARTMKITSGAAPKGSGQVMVDEDTADKHHLKLGDEIGVISAVGTHTAKISGIAHFTVTNPGAAIFYLDTPTAQKTLVGRTGVYTNVNVTAAAGVGDARLKQDVTAATGGHYKVQTAKETADANSQDVGGFLDVMKYAMLGFAGIAFLVGIFLIINTFSMLVAQRTREIGLMRAIGSSRKQVNRSVLVEALLLGTFGSVLGVGAGIGIAVGLMKLMGMTGMNLSTDDLTVAWTTPVIGMVLGVVVTVLAAYLPARRVRQGLPDGRPARRRLPGRREGRSRTGRARPAPHRRRMASVSTSPPTPPRRARARCGSASAWCSACSGSSSSARCSRAVWCVSWARSCCGRSARWDAWPSATPCATRAAPAPPAPPS